MFLSGGFVNIGKVTVFYLRYNALAVSIVSYIYKRHPGEFKIGVIADDTHEYISSKEHNHLDNGNSIGLLFKAVQELSARVEKLENSNLNYR